MPNYFEKLTNEFYAALEEVVRDTAPKTYVHIRGGNALVEKNSTMPEQLEDYLDLQADPEAQSIRVAQSSYELITTNSGIVKSVKDFESAAKFFDVIADDIVKFTGAKFSGTDVTNRMPSI